MATRKKSARPRKRAKRFTFPKRFEDRPPTYEEYKELMDEYTSRAKNDNQYEYLLNKFYDMETKRIHDGTYNKAYAKGKISEREQDEILERAFQTMRTILF